MVFRWVVSKILRQLGLEFENAVPRRNDLYIRDTRFWRRAALFGTYGVAKTYIEGGVEIKDLYSTLWRVMRLRNEERVLPYLRWPRDLAELWIWILNFCTDQQNPNRSRRVGQEHYDMGHTHRKVMLEESGAYSCGYFGAGAKTLNEAQFHKYRIIAEKLGIKRGDRVLEIGCGWGGFAAFIAREYGASVLGVTISKEQWLGATRDYRDLVDSTQVEFRLMDYRDLPRVCDERFDHVVSIGMFEHVGRRHHGTFFAVCHRMLKPGGKFLLHCIVGNGYPNPFIWYYVFRGGELPRVYQFMKAAYPYFGPFCRDQHEFGADYATTLGHWLENFNANWEEIKAELKAAGHKRPYIQRFKRTWRLYLTICKVLFAHGHIGLIQTVFIKAEAEPAAEPYRSIRPTKQDLDLRVDIAA